MYREILNLIREINDPNLAYVRNGTLGVELVLSLSKGETTYLLSDVTEETFAEISARWKEELQERADRRLMLEIREGRDKALAVMADREKRLTEEWVATLSPEDQKAYHHSFDCQ